MSAGLLARLALLFVTPYVALAALGGRGPVVLETLLAGWAALVAPGAVGVLALRGGGAARRFVGALASASLVNVGAAVALKLLGIAPGPASFAVALGVLTVAGAAITTTRGSTLPSLSRERLGVGVALVTFSLAFFSGSVVVPPLEDQDSEVQGTAWGLAHDLEPLCLTNRSTLYFFAHPLLLHALNASTITLAGDLAVVKPPYDAASAERAKLPEAERARGIPAIVRAIREPAPRRDHSFVWFHEVFKPFRENPALLSTRAPNFVLAAAAAVLILAWSRRLGAGALDATMLVAAYATAPEVFVRSGYGGYYALTAALLLAGAWLATGESGGARAGYLAGVLGALANQKVLIVAAAVALARGISTALARSGASLTKAFPYLLGVALGGAVFWAYGLWLAPSEFLADHVLDHGLRRMSGGEVLDRAGKEIYPSRLGLWLEFARHMGWVWCLVVLAGVVRGAKIASAHLTGRAPDPDAGTAATVLLGWILVGAILFTAIDWRQTKHLSLLVPALTVLIAPLFARIDPRARWVLRGGLGFAVVWNLTWIVRLARDFDSFPMSTIW